MALTDYQPVSEDPRVADVERDVVSRAQTVLDSVDDVFLQSPALQKQLREIGVDCTHRQASDLLDLLDGGDSDGVQRVAAAIVADAG